MFLLEPAQAKHLVGIHRAVDAVSREQRFFSTSEAMPFDDFINWMEQNLRRNSPQYVAVSTEGVIGWAIIRQEDQPFLAHSGCLFMGLLPHWRSRGIGSQLLASALSKAWRTGLSRIHLEVYADNEVAIQLYSNFGFVGEGVKRRAHLRDGVYRDVLSMALLADCIEQEPVPPAHVTVAMSSQNDGR